MYRHSWTENNVVFGVEKSKSITLPKGKYLKEVLVVGSSNTPFIPISQSPLSYGCYLYDACNEYRIMGYGYVSYETSIFNSNGNAYTHKYTLGNENISGSVGNVIITFTRIN